MSQRFNRKPKAKAASNQLEAQVQAKLQYALAWHQQGQLPQAQAMYEEILKVQPRQPDALRLSGIVALETNNPQKAVGLFSKAIATCPGNATLYFLHGEAHYNLGLALQELKQFETAIASYDRALALAPDYADACQGRGNALQELKQFEAAIASYDRALALAPGNAAACYNRGLVFHELKQLDAAVASYDQAIAIMPDYAAACYNRGLALQELKQPEAALASYNQAIALKPDCAEACYNRGNLLRELKQLDAAVASYDQAIAIKPDYAEACQNRGIALQDLQQLDAAVASFDQAIAIKPDYADAYTDRGNALQKLKQYQAAIESYDLALAIKPDYEFLYGLRLNSKMSLCDWEDAENQRTGLLERIKGNEKAFTPFPVLALSDSLPLQRKAAEIWVKATFPENILPGNTARHPRHEKIRLGYFSMDFRIHPVSALTAELFETHDRNRFEVIAFSYGPDTQDEMRQRLEGAFDRFIEVRYKSDQEIAELARRLELDIAIDLAGFTAGARTGIFAMRAAPVQVNFLGYPGTMGADYIDYLIADRQLVPAEAEAQYAEKIVCLPCFQPNDSKRKISERVFTRAELGLPESGFVFCCFNKSYKITPGVFAGWMRILKQVEGSVLWLSETSPAAANNLRHEAAKLGIEARRLVFAKREALVEDHLARHRAADLFVDTLPYNAHTTASDALWAGLPVLTCPGEAFASRVAASLLTAIELPELITTSQEEYEALAVELATDPERLKAIRDKLARNRLTTLLFDTGRFTRHLEEACTQMYERCQAGLPPDHIYSNLE